MDDAADVVAFPARVSAPLLSGVGLSVIGVLWAYEGWQYVTFSAGEARDPQRTFPRGIVLGTTALIVVYLLANVAYLAALGPVAAGPVLFERLDWRPLGIKPVLPIAAAEPPGRSQAMLVVS